MPTNLNDVQIQSPTQANQTNQTDKPKQATTEKKPRPSKSETERLAWKAAYRSGSSYAAIIESLAILGIGKMHPAAALIRQFAKTVPNFQDFKNRKGAEKTADERIVQNAIVCGREDYGRPLREQGFEIRKAHGKDGYSFGLFRCPKAVPAKPKNARATTAKAGKANQKKSGKTKAAKASKDKTKGRKAQD